MKKKSRPDVLGIGEWPVKLQIEQKDHEILIQQTYLSEYENNRIEEVIWHTEGKEMKPELRDSQNTPVVKFTTGKDTLHVVSKITSKNGVERVNEEFWSLRSLNKELHIRKVLNVSWGKRDVEIVFDKR
ncbi:MAG: hypothetical protein HC906_01235 [Bacteroidales bacterium]|nr:hypothetical protein [Bacteroidales bacterium]